jgi:hypothetical protein
LTPRFVVAGLGQSATGAPIDQESFIRLSARAQIRKSAGGCVGRIGQGQLAVFRGRNRRVLKSLTGLRLLSLRRLLTCRLLTWRCPLLLSRLPRTLGLRDRSSGATAGITTSCTRSICALPEPSAALSTPARSSAPLPSPSTVSRTGNLRRNPGGIRSPLSQASHFQRPVADARLLSDRHGLMDGGEAEHLHLYIPDAGREIQGVVPGFVSEGL